MNERTFHGSGADRLDDPERLTWLPPAEILGHIGLIAGLTVADIGAGTGYFTLPLSAAVGSEGKVFAVDLQQEMLDRIGRKLAAPGAPGNVELLKGEALATGLPAGSCDAVFMANVWHELDDADCVLAEIQKLLKTGGRFVIVDWRSDVSPPPGPPAWHRVPGEKLIRTLGDRGWRSAPPVHVGRYHYLVIARPA